MAHVLLCLRGNVTLAGDLALSDRELSVLLPGVALRRSPLDAAWPAFAAAAHERGSETSRPPLATDTVYSATLTAPQLDLLLQRATFVQQTLALPDEYERPAFVALAAAIPRLRRIDGTLFTALSAQCLTELASLVAASGGTRAGTKAPGPAGSSQMLPGEETAAALRGLVDALLGAPCGERERLGAAALARRAHASAYLTHDLHVYKAKFFPRLARAALNLAVGPTAASAAPAGLVLDPFAGSGTALLEASRLGMPSFGSDIDPLSMLIADAKLLLPHVNLATLRAPLDDGRFVGAVAPDAGSIAFPPWLARKLTPAQSATVLHDANALAAAIAALPPGAERTLARICLSDALTRKLHMRFLGTGVGRFALELRQRSVRTLFLGRYAALCREAVLSIAVLPAYGLRPPAAALTARADARALPLPAGAVSSVLTSPPYLPASSGRENYLMSKAPSLLLLGLLDADGVAALDGRATGSMRPIAGGGSDTNAAARLPATAPAAAHTLSREEQRLVDFLAGDALRAIKAEPVRRYFLELRAALLELTRVLHPGGRAAIVIGTRSTFYTFSTRTPLYRAETAELLAEAARSLGLTVDALIEVELDKGNRNARPRSLDSYSETIVLLSTGPRSNEP